MSDLTPEQAEALKYAGQLIDAGVPVFAAPPNPERPGQYILPRAWQGTVPDHAQLDRWRPGWALGAVGGHAADFLDFDPRNGGDESRKELALQGQMPRAFGVQATPSGGTHLIVSRTGERKATGFMPGVDLQAGSDEPDEGGGHGRGFIYIAPTVRPSKAPETLGQLRPYTWATTPDLEYLAEFSRGADDSLEGVLDRVHAWRNRGPAPRESAPSAATQLFASLAGETRAFTAAEAQAFCLPHLEALERAQIGEIEEGANRAAAALSHFVPAFWDADFAYSVLLAALSKTAYDPSHPASGWSAEKFRAVLDGRRPPLDDWKATVRPENVSAIEPAGDAVEALLAEMRRPSEIKLLKPPRMLVEGLLTLDSESWLIGAPGSKKSFVATDLAAHVAEGAMWQGLKVTQGRVVMIVAEGAGGMGSRLKAWEAQHGRPMSEEIYILPRPVQAANLGAWAVLREACVRIAPVLVVIDTQARVTVGLEENSAKEMGVYIEAVRSIREPTGACVLSVHHTGRTGGDARGSSAIDGAQTTELKVVSEPGTLKAKLKSEKQKDLQLAQDVELLFRVHAVGTDDDGQEITSLAIAPAGSVWERLSGQGEVDTRPYIPTFDEKDKWRQRILDHLHLYAPELGWTRAELAASLAAQDGVAAGKIKENGAYKTALKALLEATDPEGEPLIAWPSGGRMKLGSLSLIDGMAARFPRNE